MFDECSRVDLRYAQHRPMFYLAVDLAKVRDHAALVLLEYRVIPTGKRDAATYSHLYRRELRVVLVERFRIGTDYHELVARLSRLCHHPHLVGHTQLIIGKNGPGQVFDEMIRRAKLPVSYLPVATMGGNQDMQSCYSRYLNLKYQKEPWKLLAPLTLYGPRARKMFSPYRRAGPVNWTPRFDATFLDGAGFKSFLRYVENNPVRAHLTRKATDWEWSSARAHCAGEDAGGVLCLDVWRHLFGNPAVAAEAWTTFLDGPAEEVRRNEGRRPVPYNRVAWALEVVTLRAGSPPG